VRAVLGRASASNQLPLMLCSLLRACFAAVVLQLLQTQEALAITGNPLEFKKV
jgi:hypothetical protein